MKKNGPAVGARLQERPFRPHPIKGIEEGNFAFLFSLLFLGNAIISRQLMCVFFTVGTAPMYCFLYLFDFIRSTGLQCYVG